MGAKLLTVIATSVAIVGIIVAVAVIGSSVVRVHDDEACEVFYPDGIKTDNIIVQESPGLLFSGPGSVKHCFSRSTQHLTFDRTTKTGLGRVIGVLSREGVGIDLEVGVEWRVNPLRVPETARRLGYEEPEGRLLRTARAEVRNVASQYGIAEYMSGSREQIGKDIQAALQAKLQEQDGVYVDIVKVNLQHISVDAEFEKKYQEVEDAKLKQLVESAREEIIRIDENRLNQTQFIQHAATRNQRLRSAEAATVQAVLDQARQTTEANTTALQAMIVAESDRINRLIRARTLLDETEASRELYVERVSREALANKTLAETNRLNMQVIAEGNISRALANRTRDIAVAQIHRTKQLESLVTQKISQVLELFRIDNEANFTAEVAIARGDAAAGETLAAERAQSSHYVMLRDTLGLSDTALATILMYQALGRNKPEHTQAFLDYARGPFSLEAQKPMPAGPAIHVQVE